MTSRRLTIVQMVPEMQSGGVEKGTVELSAELVNQGHRSIIISNGGRLVEKIIADGGEHIQWNVRAKSPLTLRWIFPLRKFLAENQVDILHARSRIPAWIAYFAWKGMPAATRPHFVTTAHGLYSVNQYSEVMTRGEKVIAISETVKSYLQKSYSRLDTDLIQVIPRGVDPLDFPRGFQPSQAWQESWFQEFPQLLGNPVLSLIGRLTRLKGHQDFIEMIDLLRKDLPDIRGLIVGGKDPRRSQYAEELKRVVHERNLQDNIVFAGHRSDIKEIYSISNIVMGLTSNPPEAFGRTTVEALTMGIPVVGYNHGGTGEILQKVFPQGLIPVGDVSFAVEQIKQLLANHTFVPTEHPYLKSKMLADTLSVYEELAA